MAPKRFRNFKVRDPEHDDKFTAVGDDGEVYDIKHILFKGDEGVTYVRYRGKNGRFRNMIQDKGRWVSSEDRNKS